MTEGVHTLRDTHSHSHTQTQGFAGRHHCGQRLQLAQHRRPRLTLAGDTAGAAQSLRWWETPEDGNTSLDGLRGAASRLETFLAFPLRPAHDRPGQTCPMKSRGQTSDGLHRSHSALPLLQTGSHRQHVMNRCGRVPIKLYLNTAGVPLACWSVNLNFTHIHAPERHEDSFHRCEERGPEVPVNLLKEAQLVSW